MNTTFVDYDKFSQLYAKQLENKHHCYCPCVDCENFVQCYKDNLESFHFYVRKYLSVNRSYGYLLTLTIKSEDDYLHMFNYCQNIKTRVKALNISELYYSIEHTKKGVPHIHMAIISRAPIKKNRFKTYEKIGIFDFSPSKSKDIGEIRENLLNYISKESDPVRLF